MVKQGQALYQIDAAPYQAQVASAQADLARAQANLVAAKSIADRYKPLVEAAAVSKQEFDNAIAAQRQGEAEVAAARAQVRVAQINLGLRQRQCADLRSHRPFAGDRRCAGLGDRSRPSWP